MRDTLIDLYQHQEWADAELWRACEGHGGALQDKALWERLYHIHLVQRAFLVIARGLDVRAMKFAKPGDYASPGELKAEAQRYHADARSFLRELQPADVERTIVIPWFKDPPLELPIGQALLQAAMHSHYHRAQNVTRLRELGGTPPLTDYIVWLWKGKAPASWQGTP
jgi:uncharacterized damage-inducible protein DinB